MNLPNDTADLVVLWVLLTLVVIGPWLLKSPPKFEDKPKKK